MPDAPAKRAWPLVQRLLRHRAWILVGLTVLLSLVVRVRLREMPLERDEGEYAYAGQLILHGVPPYKEAYNLKLPGTFVAYAVIMASFGQSPSAIHFGLALLNAASIVLMYGLGKKLLDEVAGIGAAVAYGILSLSPSVLGLAGHATHFVVFFALGGLLWLARSTEGGGRSAEPVARLGTEGVANGGTRLSRVSNLLFQRPHTQLLLSGLCFGFSFLMKQHGLLFGVFGGLYLIWVWLNGRFGWEEARRLRLRKRRRAAGKRPLAPDLAPAADSARITASRHLPGSLAAFTGAFLLPYLVACIVLWGAGAFHQFWFWTISYAGKYASAIPIVSGPDVLRAAINVVVGPNLVFWILPWIGALVMWWEDALNLNHRFFLAGLLLCSFASVSLGFYFREHYFILLLPALSLLSGVAVSRGLRLLQHDTTIELFLAVPMLGLYVVGLLFALIGNGALWFGLSPAAAVLEIYGSTLFLEAVKVGDFLQLNTTKDARVAVIGSEPEIYFYAHRRSATGYIYTYPLMEEQPYALKMQEEMIAEIESRRPEYVVFVQDDFSWLPKPNSQRRIYDWWEAFWATNLDLVMTVNVVNGRDEEPKAKPASRPAPPLPATHLLILKRKPN